MNDDLRAAVLTTATAFFDEHAAQFLSRDEDQLQSLCADTLGTRYGISQREAMALAMEARADMLSADAGGFVDVERCTSRMVILRDTAQARVHMLPVSRLLEIARHG